MNNIEILENAIKCNKKQFEEIGTHILLQDDEMKAIENLIQENKELKDLFNNSCADLENLMQENEELHREINQRIKLKLENERCADKDFIPKSKVKEKIEILEKLQNEFKNNDELRIKIIALKELLKGE